MPSHAKKWRRRVSLKYFEQPGHPAVPRTRSHRLWFWVATAVVVAGIAFFWRGRLTTANRDAVLSRNLNPEIAQAPAMPAEQNAAERARGCVIDGNDLLREGKLDAALERFGEALKITPDDEDIHFNMGITLARLRRFDEAIEHYAEAIRLLPQYAEARNNLGNALAMKNRLEEAAAQFKSAIDIMPQHASAHNNLGTVLARQGKLDEAVTNFSKAVQLQSDYFEAYVNLGSSLLSLGRTNEALQNLEYALKLQPSFEPAMRLIQKIRGSPAPVSEGSLPP
jgi:Tfp pilus assembly protein PilF